MKHRDPWGWTAVVLGFGIVFYLSSCTKFSEAPKIKRTCVEIEGGFNARLCNVVGVYCVVVGSTWSSMTMECDFSGDSDLEGVYERSKSL